MTRNESLSDVRRPNLTGTPQNKTTSFMLPAINLAGGKTDFRLLEYYGFVNIYLEHKEDVENHPGCLYMLFNPSDEALKRFGEFYDIYRTYPNFVTDYVIDFNLIVLVFKVKDKWRSTLEAFKASKYSKMTREYAELFKVPDLATGRVYLPDEYHVITKSKEYKKKLEDMLSNYPKSPVILDDSQELMDPLDLKKEILSYGYTDKPTTQVLTWEGQC